MLGVIACTILLFTLYMLMKRSKSQYAICGRHVLITGGSSGIGLALAIEARKQGANVTIISRSQKKLDQAKNDILEASGKVGDDTWVNTLSLDVTADWTIIDDAMTDLVKAHGPVHILINCAGYAEGHYFAAGTQHTFESMMKLNLFGSVAVTRALLPSMRKDAAQANFNGGCICFISSVAGQVGVFGYTSYSATKFALRGLAETLYWELLNDGISITLAHPPDTATPGYENEEKTKPPETKALSEAAGLVNPDVVAKSVLRDTLNRRFFSGLGFEGWMLAVLTAGMAPNDSFLQAVSRVVFSGPLHIIATGYRFWMRCVIRGLASSKTASAVSKDD